MTAPRRWLSVAEAAVMSGHHRDTVSEALRSGELVGYQRKPGGRWRIAPEAVDAWVTGEPLPSRPVPAVTRRSA